MTNEVKTDGVGTTSEKYSGGWPFVTLRMAPDHVQQLKSYAADRCLNVSNVIRIALLEKGVIKPREVV